MIKHYIHKKGSIISVVILLAAFLLTGTQCAEESPLQLPAEDIVILAAKDTPPEIKAQANLICDGIDDNEQIQEAIDAMHDRGGGEILLLKGTYVISFQLYMKSNVTLRGQGYDTLIEPHDIASCIRIKGVTDVLVGDLRIEVNGNARYAVDVIDSAKRVTVENIWAFDAIDDEISVVHGSEDVIIRNCTIKGRYGGPSQGNIEVGDESKRVTVAYNTLLGGHPDRAGIHANAHAGQWEPMEDLVVIGNTINGVGTNGMNITADNITIADNVIENAGQNGIFTQGRGGCSVANNLVINAGEIAICVSDTLAATITGNQVIESGGGIVLGWTPESVLVDGNLVKGSKSDGIKIMGGNNITISNNNLEDNVCGISVDTPVAEVTVTHNHISSDGYGLILGRLVETGATIDRVLISENEFNDNTNGWLLLAAIIKDLEVKPSYPDPIVDCLDRFQGMLPATIDHVHKAVYGTGTEQEITDNITNPDYPRNISITATNNSAPSGRVKIEGINSRGQNDSEEITIIPGGTAFGQKAFASITSITIPAGVSPADTVTTGISDKFGLSHPFHNSADVYKIEGRPANWPKKIDVANGTFDFAVVPPLTDPNFPNYRVWYKTHLTGD